VEISVVDVQRRSRPPDEARFRRVFDAALQRLGRDHEAAALARIREVYGRTAADLADAEFTLPSLDVTLDWGAGATDEELSATWASAMWRALSDQITSRELVPKQRARTRRGVEAEPKAVEAAIVGGGRDGLGAAVSTHGTTGVMRKRKGTERSSGVAPADYAVFFGRGDKYQTGAKLYMKAWHPGHRQLDATSFEDMFVKLAGDIRARRAGGEAFWIREIALVTHAVAGGLMVPLSEDDRKKGDREFTPDDVIALQNRYRDGALARLRGARAEVIAAFDPVHTRIVVRGCNFGQSSEGLAALRDVFGGRVSAWAPKGYQVFQVLSLGAKEDSAALKELGITDAATAYDFLVKQRYLTEPDDEALVAAGFVAEGATPTSEQRRRYKAKYVEDKFGKPPVIPVEAYIAATARQTGAETDEEKERRGDEAEKKKQTLHKKEKRIVFRPEHDELVLEPREIAGFLPTERPSAEDYESRTKHWGGGRVWGASYGRLGTADPEIDRLSRDEIIRRAATLRNPYRPENAAMLVRLMDSYKRRPTASDLNDPLWPLPRVAEYFGDEDRLGRDAALHPGAPAYDVLEKETLKYRKPKPEQQARAEEETRRARELAGEIAVPAGAMSRAQQLGERDFDARGRVDPLPDGIRLWNFAVNGAELRPQFKQPLLELAKRVARKTDVTLTIDGHTSSSGDEAHNDGLAAARAQQVLLFLQAAGVPAPRMVPTGYGERRPVVPERKGRALVPRNMAQNRRVEVRMVKAAAPPAKPSVAPAPKASKVEPGLVPITPVDAIAIKTDLEIPLPGRTKVGVVIVTGALKFAFQGTFGLRDARKIVKLTPDERKAAFEYAVKTELGNVRIEGEVKDGKASKVKIGLSATEMFDIDFAAATDLRKAFQVEFKLKTPPGLTTITVGDWVFRGQVSGSALLYFGPDPTVVATLAQRGGRVIVRAVARGGAALNSLFFTELGTVTALGAVAVGVGVAAAGVTWLGFVLYQIGEAHKEGRWRRAASEFAWGYGHFLMELTQSEKGVHPLVKSRVTQLVPIDWPAEFKKYVKPWIDDEDQAAFDRLYDLGRAAVAQDYNAYVKLYGDEAWNKLAAAHRRKYGEDFQVRENRYKYMVWTQLKERKSAIGVPLEVGP
jgi:outer membrane protein OmpA-like peptidoglycan-associated protein